MYSTEDYEKETIERLKKEAAEQNSEFQRYEYLLIPSWWNKGITMMWTWAGLASPVLSKAENFVKWPNLID